MLRSINFNKRTILKIIGRSWNMPVFTAFYPKNRFSFCTSHRISDEEEEDLKIESKLDLDIFESIKTVSNNLKCQGCGICLQTQDKNKIGFIPSDKIIEYMNQSDNIKSEHVNQRVNEELSEFEKIHDKGTLKRLMKLNSKKNIIICERCYKLKNYSKFEDLNTTNTNLSKVNNYTNLVKKINEERLIHQIMTRISNKAHIFYICDISELEATLNKSVLKLIAEKNIPLTIIVNKYDILPTKVVPERVRVWVGEFLKDYTEDILGLVYSYVIVSSKNGFNFDHVIHKIKMIKEKAKENKTPRPKIFVLGNTNVGKSSFINKLIYRCNKYAEKRMNTLEYKKDYQITENKVFEIPEAPEGGNLTASPLPGTTIGITKVESMKMGIKLFDTPGIPNKKSMNYLMENYIDIISATICKQIIPFTSSIKQGYSIWLGALARIDFLNGDDKYLCFFLSHHVTIHRTPLLNAEDLFHKHAGTLLRPCITKDLNELKLVKHTFNLNCDIYSLLNFDIAITGLGWFSISGKGLTQLEVHVPEGVSVYMRNKPLMPYEIKSRGVKKFFGKTINSNSKINRKFNKK
jgi:ribosome biogenesis GTPase A